MPAKKNVFCVEISDILDPEQEDNVIGIVKSYLNKDEETLKGYFEQTDTIEVKRLSEEEVKRVVSFLIAQMKPDYDSTILNEIARDEELEQEDGELDEKYDQAVELVVQTGQASISMVQRKLRVGYNRAARMIETMEREGIVGPSDGVRPREVFGRREL